MLFEIHGCLNITENVQLPKIYEEYRHTIQNADSHKDLKWWSNNHGVGMAMNWPVFEVSIFGSKKNNFFLILLTFMLS